MNVVESSSRKLGSGTLCRPPLVIYTRTGTEEGKHEEYRCKKCEAGHYYVFRVTNDTDMPYKYDDTALDAEYLVTTRDTGYILVFFDNLKINC